MDRRCLDAICCEKDPYALKAVLNSREGYLKHFSIYGHDV